MIFKKNKVKQEKTKKESRLKIREDEQIQEGEIIETEWDFKRVIIGLVMLVLAIIVGSYIFFPSDETKPQALGVSTENLSPTPPLPNKEDIQGILDSAKQTLSKITSENLTSSQSAIQKVINDLETLKGREGALNLMCNMVCEK